MSVLLRCFLVLAVVVVGVSPLVAQDFNSTTQKESGPRTDVPLPVRSNSIEVLWDLTHGVYIDYEPAGTFSNLVAALPSYNFTTTTAGIDNVNLFDYQILVICVGSAWDSPYTAAEVSAATQYANAGGSILILGDNPQSQPQNINPIAQAFGVTTGVTDLTPGDLYFVNFAPHVIFTGVNEAYFRAGGELTVAGPSVPIAWTNDGSKITIAASIDPCVVTVGDINVFAEPEYFFLVDNVTLAENVFEYLVRCSPLPVVPITWGEIKALYR